MSNEKDFSILVIEDHAEMQELIRSILETDYNIHVASDGAEGFRLAQEEIPDLIVTDIAMPLMNGWEFCEKLKCTFETSHIPVIMITAKAMEEDQLRGYQSGAADYIVKPFNVAILQLKIRNILDSVKKIRDRFSIEKNDFEEFTSTSMDAEWLRNLKKYIALEYHNSKLSVEMISAELGLSKSTLYRKLKSITGKSAMDLLQEYRLQQAHAMLLNTELNVSEIAYAVGYTDPGYFGSRFKEHFGFSPSSLGKRTE